MPCMKWSSVAGYEDHATRPHQFADPDAEMLIVQPVDCVPAGLNDGFQLAPADAQVYPQPAAPGRHERLQ